jgi:hypothetical protein
MVEIALGPKAAFENGNIGTVSRCVPPDRVVSAVPLSRRRPKPLRKPRTPLIVELLRKAVTWQALLESGDMISRADLARHEGVTRARVTQIMGMLRLDSKIQEHILNMSDVICRPALTERALRPIAQLNGAREQFAAFSKLVGKDERK